MNDLQSMLSRATIGDGTLPVPVPPTFDDPATERTYVKQRLAVAFRIFAHFGFDDGLAGHITVRDPGHTDRFWVNPVGIHFSKIRASDLVLVSHEGEVLEGAALVNRAAFAIHSSVHQARPDVQAVAHAHSRFGRAFSTLGRLLDPISQDACVFFENHAVYDSFHGVVEETTEGERIAAALGDHAAAILQNHGLLTVGRSVDIACNLFVQMERCCETQILAASSGTPTLVPREVALNTRSFNGSELVLWGGFQPLYQILVEEDPTVLD